MKIPDSFRSNQKLDEKTEDLLKREFKGRLAQVVHHNLTVENLIDKEVSSGHLTLTCVMLNLEYKKYKYDLDLSTCHHDNEYPQIKVRQTDREKNLPKLVKLSSIVTDYYSAKEVTTFDRYYRENVVKILPPAQKLLPFQIISDIKNFYIPNFKDVRISFVRYQDLSLRHRS